MRAYIITDFVGSCGIFRRRQWQIGTREWRQAKRMATHDVNAAIEGLRRAGFEDIVVRDLHGGGCNLSRRVLLPRVEYRPGFFLRPVPVLGDVEWAHCAVLVGFHAGAGFEEGIFCQTFRDEVRQVRVNGELMGEADLLSALLGELEIPVCFVSGEAAAVDQARAHMPWISTLAVPKDPQDAATERSAAERPTGILAPQGSIWVRKRNEIRALVEQSSLQKSALRTYVIPGPVRVEVDFRSESDARFFNSWGLEQRGARVSFERGTFLQAYGQLVCLFYVPRPMLGVADSLFRFTNVINRLGVSWA